MRRSSLLTLFAALIAAAAAILAFGLRLRGQEEAHGIARGDAVLARDPSHAVAIAAEGADGPLRLARTSAGWTALEPGHGPVDTSRVEALLADLAALRRRGTLAAPGRDPAKLAPYGLDRPRTRIELTFEDGMVLTIALGQGTGEDGAMFALAPRGEVVVISAAAGTALEADLARLGIAGGGSPAGPRGG
jgi:hypothetical protein